MASTETENSQPIFTIKTNLNHTKSNGVLSVTTASNLKPQPDDLDLDENGNVTDIDLGDQPTDLKLTLSLDLDENANVESNGKVNPDESGDKDLKKVELAVKPKRRVKQSWRTWTKEQWIILMSILVSFLFGNAAFSMLAPFFPDLATERGLTALQAGAVFSIYEIVVFFMSPVYGILIIKLEPKFMCVAGSFFSGGCCILFGMMVYVDGIAFLILCLLIRAIQGNGVAALDVAAMSVLMKTFPGHTNLIMGLLETIGGLGFVLGPILGASLYAAGGFPAPFIVTGVIVLFSCVVQYFTIKNIDETEKHTSNFLKLLTIPGVFLMFFHNTIASAAFNFTEPTLSPWMEKIFGISVVEVGLVFIAWSGAYTILSPIVGKIADRGYLFTPMLVGCFGFGFSYTLLGPAPLYDFIFQGQHYKWLVIVSCLLCGIFGAGIYVPPYQVTMNMLLVKGFDDSLATHGLIAGMLSSSYSLGAFSGPLISSELTEKFGFEWACAIVGFVLIFLGVLMALYLIIMKVLDIPLEPDYSYEEMDKTGETEV